MAGKFDPKTAQPVARFNPAQSQPAQDPNYPEEETGAPFEVLANMGSGLVNLAAGGVRGAYGTLTGEDPQKTMEAQERIRRAVTYEPTSPQAQQALDYIGYPGQVLGRAAQAGGEWVANRAGPGAGALTEATLGAAPALISKAAQPAVRGAVAEALAAGATRASQMSWKNSVLADAKAVGYKMPPDTAGGRFFTAIGGKTPTKQELLSQHQEVTNELGRKAASLAPDAPLEEATLEAARNDIAKPYRDLSKISLKAKELWDETRQKRADAKLEWKFYDRNQNPATLAKAKALDAEAAALEARIDRIAQYKLAPDALQELRDTRQKLAQNYDVDRALVGGDFSARRLVQNSENKQLSGVLKTVADFETLKTPLIQKMMYATPTTHVTAAVGEHGAGAAVGGLGPAIPFVSHVARQMALSDLFQPRAPYYGPGLGLRALAGSVENPTALGAYGLTGLQPPMSVDEARQTAAGIRGSVLRR